LEKYDQRLSPKMRRQTEKKRTAASWKERKSYIVGNGHGLDLEHCARRRQALEPGRRRLGYPLVLDILQRLQYVGRPCRVHVAPAAGRRLTVCQTVGAAKAARRREKIGRDA
jgi:hypothetical protein